MSISQTGAKHHRSLSADATVMLASKGLVGLLNVSALVLVARTVGPAGQGIVAVALAMALILIQMGSLGLVTSNPAIAAREPSAVPGLVANTLWLALAIGLTIVALGTLARALAPTVLEPLDGVQLAVVLGVVPFALGAQLIRSILLGVGRTVAYNAGELALSAGALVAVVLGLAVFHGGVTTAIVLLLGQYPVGLVLYSVLLRKGSGWSLRPDAVLLREMFHLALRVYPATVLSYVLIKVDLLLVERYLGATETGYYSAAVVIAQGLFLLPMVVGLNLFPRVARSRGTAQTAEVFRVTAVVYGTACLIVAALASPLVLVVYGSAFADAVPLLLWLLPGTFCLGMVTLLSYHFAGRGYPLQLIVYWALALVLNLALNVVLLPEYGTIVAPVASSFCYALVLLLHARLFATTSGGWGQLRPRFAEAAAAFAAVIRRCSA